METKNQKSIQHYMKILQHCFVSVLEIFLKNMQELVLMQSI